MSDETKYRLLQKIQVSVDRNSSEGCVCGGRGGSNEQFRFFLCYQMVLLLHGGPSEVHISIPYGNLFQGVGVCVWGGGGGLSV